VPRAYKPFKAYNISLEKKSQNKKPANFNLKYLFRYLNDKNNNLSRCVSQQPHSYNHRHSSVGLVDNFSLMFTLRHFYVQIQKLSRRMSIVA
jgi:hypothetical protein